MHNAQKYVSWFVVLLPKPLLCLVEQRFVAGLIADHQCPGRFCNGQTVIVFEQNFKRLINHFGLGSRSLLT